MINENHLHMVTKPCLSILSFPYINTNWYHSIQIGPCPYMYTPLYFSGWSSLIFWTNQKNLKTQLHASQHIFIPYMSSMKSFIRYLKIIFSLRKKIDILTKVVKFIWQTLYGCWYTCIHVWLVWIMHGSDVGWTVKFLIFHHVNKIFLLTLICNRI